MTKPKDITETEKIIANNLVQRRYELGLSQVKVAKILGITFQQLQKYEQGGNRISAGRLFQLADIYGYTAEDLRPKNLKAKPIYEPEHNMLIITLNKNLVTLNSRDIIKAFINITSSIIKLKDKK